MESGGAVRRLGPVELANRRLKQRAFNNIINQMAQVRRTSLEGMIERAEEIGDEDAVEDYQAELRTVKQTAIRSADRKQALRDLERYHHGDTPKGRRRQRREGITEAEALEREKLALIILGRREGIPDWVPVGESDNYRRGRLRR